MRQRRKAINASTVELGSDRIVHASLGTSDGAHEDLQVGGGMERLRKRRRLEEASSSSSCASTASSGSSCPNPDTRASAEAEELRQAAEEAENEREVDAQMARYEGVGLLPEADPRWRVNKKFSLLRFWQVRCVASCAVRYIC